MAKYPKTEKAELSRRITEVYKLLMGSYKRVEICQYASKKEWGVDVRTVDRYIAKATKKIEEEQFESREVMRKKALHEYEDIARRSKKDRQYGVALGCQTQKNKMFGLDEPEKHEHSGEVKIAISSLFPEELKNKTNSDKV